MKHRLITQLKAENKRLKAKLREANKREVTNDCPMCGGISDGSIEKLKKKAMHKCH